MPSASRNKSKPQSEVVTPEDNRRFAALLKAFEADRHLAPIAKEFKTRPQASSQRRFGSNALKVDGRIFAMLVKDHLVVKLPKERAAALCATGACDPFDPGHGRVMKEWVTVMSPTLSWPDLAKEAYKFVSTKDSPSRKRTVP